MMRVRYIGPSFGAFGLTNGKVYECLGVELDGQALRVIDDEGYAYWELEPDEKEGYLYSAKHPAPMDGSVSGGHFEIVEDDERGSLHRAIFG